MSSVTSQHRCCRLRDALYSRLPEGLNARAVTGSVSPVNVEVTLPDDASTSCDSADNTGANGSVKELKKFLLSCALPPLVRCLPMRKIMMECVSEFHRISGIEATFVYNLP